jgi:endonuclease/exonuclease/phosphatase family metal-dependent hydrolase
MGAGKLPGMKLLQLNIWHGRLMTQIDQLLRREQPDIVCLQEVYSSDVPSAVFGDASAHEHIAQTLQGYHHYFSPAYTIAVLDKKAGFGLSMFSRLPLSDTKTIPVWGEYKDFTEAAGLDTNIRSLQKGVVTAPGGKQVTVFNHHGYWIPNQLGDQVTIKSLQRVADAVKPVDGAVLLAGDFNVTAESPAMRAFDGWITNLTAKNNVRTTLSPLSRVHEPIACDHIMVTRHVSVNRFEVLEDVASDHLALVLDFDI